MKKIAIVNYGMGNLRSVYNAFVVLGCPVFVADAPVQLSGVSGLVLPGVGAFSDAMKNLKDAGWIKPLEDLVLNKKTPFLGICLGLQLLATASNEHGLHEGFNWINATVDRISDEGGQRVPHIGWNDVQIKQADSLYKGCGQKETFYFVHSYAFFPENSEIISGTFSYGRKYVASIEKDNIFAVQFHPEKSQKSGLKVLKNFIEHCYA